MKGIGAIHNVCFTFGVCGLKFNPQSFRFETCSWRLWYCFLFATLMCTSFLCIVIFDTLEFTKNQLYWYVFMSQLFLAVTPLLLALTCILRSHRQMRVLNQILTLEAGPRGHFYRNLIFLALLYYGPILISGYFWILDIQVVNILEEMQSLMSYHTVTVMILVWTVEHLVIIRYINLNFRLLQREFNEYNPEMYALLDQYQDLLGISKKFVKLFNEVMPWMAFFTIYIFIGVLFFSIYLVELEIWIREFRIYVALADAPLCVVYFLVKRINDVWCEVSFTPF